MVRPKERYINPKMEKELEHFKKEVEKRFLVSTVNKDYIYPRKKDEPSLVNLGSSNLFPIN